MTNHILDLKRYHSPLLIIFLSQWLHMHIPPSSVTSWMASKTETSFWDNWSQMAPSPRAHSREALIFQYILWFFHHRSSNRSCAKTFYSRDKTLDGARVSEDQRRPCSQLSAIDVSDVPHRPRHSLCPKTTTKIHRLLTGTSRTFAPLFQE